MDDFSNAKILIVDDTQTNISMITKILTPLCCEITSASSGEEALQKLAAINPDLILLDVMMPGIDGFETCEKIKQMDHYKNIPIIFITALTETADLVRAFTVGGVDYISKPVKSNEVKARVKTHLENYFLQQENTQNLIKLKEANASKDKLFEVVTNSMFHSLIEISESTTLLNDILSDQDLNIEDAKSFVSNMGSNSRNMQRMLCNLQQWSLLETGKLKYHPSHTFVETILEDIAHHASQPANDKNINIQLNYLDEDKIFADLNMLDTILRNLVFNAIQFSPENTRITIDCKATPETATLSVADEGPGIQTDPEDKQKVQNKSNCGLGLSLIQRLLAYHHSELLIESDERGTKMSFQIATSAHQKD